MINIRFANKHDSQIIFNWRNDPVSRKMSHTKNIVGWEKHTRWFTDSLANQNKLILLCEEDGTTKKVAVVHFESLSNRALISINMSSLFRGKGKAKYCLNNSIHFFAQHYPNVSYIDAQIKSLNFASKHAFESVGFYCIRKEKDMLFYEYKVKTQT